MYLTKTLAACIRDADLCSEITYIRNSNYAALHDRIVAETALSACGTVWYYTVSHL